MEEREYQLLSRLARRLHEPRPLRQRIESALDDLRRGLGLQTAWVLRESDDRLVPWLSVAEGDSAPSADAEWPMLPFAVEPQLALDAELPSNSPWRRTPLAHEPVRLSAPGPTDIAQRLTLALSGSQPDSISAETLPLLRSAAAMLAGEFVRHERDHAPDTRTGDLQSLVELAPDGIYILDEALNIEFVNRRLAHMLGYEPHELEGRPAVELAPRHELPRVTEYLRRWYDGLTIPGAIRFQLRHKSGTTVDAEVFPAVSPNDRRQLRAGYVRDVGPRRRSEEQARLNRARFRELLERFHAIVIGTDPNGVVTVYNPFAEATLGYEAAEIVGRSIFEVLYRDIEVRALLARRFVAAVSSNETPEEYMSRPRARDGRILNIVWNLYLQRDAADRIETVYHIGQDLTALSRAQSALETTNRRLAEKNREMETLLQAVSHDLRNPLFALNGYLQMLSDAGDAERRQTLTNQSRRSLEVMIHLLDDLADLAQAGYSDQPAQPVPVRRPLEQALSEQRTLARSRNIRIETEGPVETLAVYADFHRLYQVFSNLLGNAVKFMHRTEGGRICVRVLREESTVCFEVLDNGPGIPADLRRRIFRPFERAGQTEIPGTGMGLAIVRRIVERFGGAIECIPGPEGGTAFRFRLPVAPDVPPD